MVQIFFLDGTNTFYVRTLRVNLHKPQLEAQAATIESFNHNPKCFRSQHFQIDDDVPSSSFVPEMLRYPAIYFRSALHTVDPL